LAIGSQGGKGLFFNQFPGAIGLFAGRRLVGPVQPVEAGRIRKWNYAVKADLANKFFVFLFFLTHWSAACFAGRWLVFLLRCWHHARQ
jgi:hypothetical protein